MSKKHYEKSAEILRETIKDREARLIAAVAFADMFAADNPRFDQARFLKACGTKDGRKV